MNTTSTNVMHEAELLSVPEFAAAISVSIPTATSFLLRGIVPYTIIGCRRFVRCADVNAFRGQFPAPVPRIGQIVELKSGAR